MAKSDLIDGSGDVIECFAGANFKVKLDDGMEILATIKGTLRKNRIKITVGDRVIVSRSPYDPSRGLISRRL